MSDQKHAKDFSVYDNYNINDFSFSLCRVCNRGSGGALGAFGPGQMVKEFDDVVFTGEIGKVLGPVQTQFGFHLIEVTKRSE